MFPRSSYLVLALALSSQGAEFRAKVIRILDGDTIEVLHQGRPVRVRFLGIDAPEKNQAFSSCDRSGRGQPSAP